MQILTVLYQSNLSLTQIEEVFRARTERNLAVPGLLEKLYVHDPASGRFGAIYVFDTTEHLNRFRASDLANSLAAAYQVTDRPQVRLYDVVMDLRRTLRATAPAGQDAVVKAPSAG